MRSCFKKIYEDSNDVKSEDIGPYICPVCGQSSRLIHQKGMGFQNILSICQKEHTCEIAKELYKKYNVGDRIRLYESTFGEDAAVCANSYEEGVIIKVYSEVIDFRFDFKIDKCVVNGNEALTSSWIIGSIHEGVAHSSVAVKLLQKVNKSSYEQLSFF